MDCIVWKFGDENQNTLINQYSQNGIERDIKNAVQTRDRDDKGKPGVPDGVPHPKKPFGQKIEARTVNGEKIPSTYTDLSAKLRIHRIGGDRCMVAIDAIDTGKKIAQRKPFACVADRTTLPYCITCKARKSIFIMCAKCNLVLYCKSKTCQSSNKTHKFECGTNFHCIQYDTESDVKLAIQMIFESLVIYDEDVAKLKKAVIEYRSNDRDYPVRIKTAIEKFHCIMKLCSHSPDDHDKKVHESFRIITQLPQIARLFQTDAQKDFLKHLLAHFLKVIAANSFEAEQDGINLTMIYDSISFFNHSCSPNALNFIIQTKMIIISSQHIKSDDEVRICYVPDFHDIAWETDDRQHKLWDTWKFNCCCDRCKHSDSCKQEGDNDHDLREINKNDIESVESNFRGLSDVQKVDFLANKLGAITSDENYKWTPEVGAYCIEFFKACKKQMPGQDE